MAESIMLDKAKDFAVEIINMCKNIKETKRESVLTNQLMRSGTSIGANIHESKYAHGTADFISKMQIALKECYESEYWLELLNRTGYIDDEQYKSIINDCGQIRRMLISSINTVKENKAISEKGNNHMFMYVDNQQIKEEFKKLAIEEKITMAEIAKRCDMIPQELNNRFSNKRIAFSDLKLFLNACGYDLKIEFVKKTNK